ncbi:hypothetical protein Bhyg_11236 [Pseudolycoriella hygida]|uniref:RING-type domain-containing protein n=1 Tax=Pseudolycoriella hygida TaxID=35572 RepID=A0A9Q0MV63_9DIPT|nr:hypothetical protein Bhyg_11236 [Pseudolycoriella hygida]
MSIHCGYEVMCTVCAQSNWFFFKLLNCGCIMCLSCIMETLQHPISICPICSDEEVEGYEATPIFPANKT